LQLVVGRSFLIVHCSQAGNKAGVFAMFFIWYLGI